jgi:hypothetical protein
VRVRIVRPSVGIMDGVSLSHLTPGTTYDVPSELAYWLMSRGVAERVADDAAGVVVPLDNPLAFEQLTHGVSVIPPAAEAADAPSDRRTQRKRR